MKKWYLLSAVLIIILVTLSSSQSQEKQGQGTGSNTFNRVVGDIGAAGPNTRFAPTEKVKIEKNYGKIPLAFIPNHGQMDKQVYYYIQGKDKNVYFTSGGLTYSLSNRVEDRPVAGEKIKLNSFRELDKRYLSWSSKRWIVKLNFVGARKDAKPEPFELSGTKISYFKGQQKEWKTGLQAASKIQYRDLWPGIDLVYYGTVNRMKYEFIVHPGADPTRIKLAYRGAERVKENSQGQLEVQTPVGGFYDDTPVAWQEIDGKRKNVVLKYAIEEEKSAKDTLAAGVVTYGFTVGKYDPKKKLILDPTVIVYCGYIGGSGMDCGYGIAVDASGCVYVTGNTNSTETDFPVTEGADLTYNGGVYDAFVAKVKADGTGLVYCGYIGGSAYDFGFGLAVDASGCAYVTGMTQSTESTFPVVGGPDLTFNGDILDTFVAKINAIGTGLDYCGYIGGTGSEESYGLAVDASGCAYVSGKTTSNETTFPVICGPDLTQNGGTDAFVAKVKADGTGLVYCGFIGGSGYEEGCVLAVDTSGCAYISGSTDSTETSFPVKEGPDLTYNGGFRDSFVAKINASGTALEYCGYIGGSGYDYGYGLTVDASNYAYVCGNTNSTEATFPVLGGPDIIQNGYSDAFVAKVKADGTGLVYCGYVGGSDGDYSYRIAIDAARCAYVVGQSYSGDFPVVDGPDLTHNGSYDGFVAKVSSDGIGLLYCGYIGGSGGERVNGIALDTSACAYIVGNVYSDQSSFPVIVGPDLTHNGDGDVFVAKISGAPNYTVNFTAGNGGSLNGTTSQTVIQGGDCTAVEAIADNMYDFLNWTGTNGFVTTTDNPLTVTNVTSDMTITANFHQIILGWAPVEGLQNNMIVYGKAYNGNDPAAEGDWLGAFGPGGIPDCRAVGAIQSGGNYYLTIGSNEASGETITFKLWPLPSGPAINSSEFITFSENAVYDDLLLHFGPTEQEFNLVNGWNWISFNTLPDDTSFNAIFGTPGPLEQIKSQNKAAIYTGGNWIGDLTDMSGIADGIMYKVKTNQAYAFNVTGNTISYNTPISLVTGWNWTAYLSTLSQPVADAVDSIITPVSQVKSQTKSVIKIGSTLVGDLTDMEPNKGYLISMTQAGVLVYPQGEAETLGLSAEKIAVTKAPAVSWPVIKGNQYNMVALGKVYVEGKLLETPGYYLGSQGPKGSTDGRSLSPVKTDGAYFATILGNANDETITFKLINSTNNSTYDMAGTLVFRADSLKTGFDLKARSVRLTAPKEGAVLPVGTTCTISWRAYELNKVKIELYKGGKFISVIAASVPAGTASYRWKIPANLKSGKDYQVKATCIDTGVTAISWTKSFAIVASGT